MPHYLHNCLCENPTYTDAAFGFELSLNFYFRFDDNPYMKKRLPGPWYVTKIGEAIGVMGADSSVVAVLPEKKPVMIHGSQKPT
jgi:hypothetical protein